MRDSLAFLLPSLGFSVRCFASAEEFLAQFDAARPGCLLTDVRMPGMGGFELHEELRRRGHEIPVVVMTAYADVPTAVRSIRGGAIDFIEKPLDEQELLGCLRRALDHDREQRTLQMAEMESVPTEEWSGEEWSTEAWSDGEPETAPQGDQEAPPGGKRPTPASGAYPPYGIGQYRLLRKVSKGGMSEVFLAEDTELHRQVALMFLRLRG